MYNRIRVLEARELRKDGKRRCPRCQEIKPFSEYYTSANSNHGFDSHCIKCSRELGKLFHEAHPEKKREYYERTKRAGRDRKLQQKFGITMEQYEMMLKTQGGMCAICVGRDRNKDLAVDHCHNTNTVRGLLCGRCNPAIGYLQDDPNLARKAASYLEKHNGISVNP